MAISESDVRHVAALARLEIAEERVDGLVRELNGILVHMDVLQRIELSAPGSAEVEQSVSGVPEPTPLREDEPGSVALAAPREAFAPAVRDGFFLVPRLSTHE